MDRREALLLVERGRSGLRVIAERFGVNPSTVQRISRPFDGASVAVA
jgi:DNA-binding IclR family transcriptional regulator